MRGFLAWMNHQATQLVGAACILTALLVCILPISAAAQSADDRRAALVIGNSDYVNFGGLPNAASDARRVSDLLSDANFEVTLGEDLDKIGLERTVREFLRTLDDGDVALFYYSGHAVQVAGENFIIPVDASLSSAYDLEVQSYNVGHLLDYMRETSSMQILILDSCRDNPFKNQSYFLGDKKVDVAPKDGLAALTPRQGSLIVYSTAPDQVAYDGSGEASPFTGAMTERLLTPNTEVRELLTQIRRDVIELTDGRQVPWDVSSLISQFYFIEQQNLLVASESLGEIRVSPKATRINLGIEQPIASRGLQIAAAFDKVPESGQLILGDAVLKAGETFDARRINEVTYIPGPEEKTVQLVSYAVRASSGQEMKGVVAVVFDPMVAPEQEADEQTARVVGEIATGAAPAVEPPVARERLRPVEVAMAPVVGTGFVPISDALPADRLTGEGWLRVATRHPSTQIAVGKKILSTGDLIHAEDLPRLTIRPALEIDARDGDDAPRIILSQASDDTREEERVVINVAPAIHRCDELAGDRLDIQGVVEGVFPNEIPLADALAACREAVETFADVARFHHQLGRVLYARGEYEAAIGEFQAALDAGHVRSGQLLGRFYQLGAGVPKDPSRAIPLFEAAAARGDAFAQHSLARAHLEGNGVATDIARGLELYGKAVEAGHTYAMNGLGANYLYGRNVGKDEQRAYSMFRASADRSDVWGLMNLALLYRDGVVVEKDRARAMDMLRQAHGEKHPYAGRLIGLMLREQDNADQSEAFGYFSESAARGDAWSAYHAAEMMKSGAAREREAGETVRLYGFAVGRNAGEPSRFARERLNAMPRAAVVVEIQKALIRAGHDTIEADGALGPRTREAAAMQLGGGPPREAADLLGALLEREWIASQPRLDML